MQDYKQHIIFKIITISVVACLLLPTALKICHAFTKHEHVICKGENKSHLHEIDTDCECFKFNLSASLHINIDNHKTDYKVERHLVNVKHYIYSKSHQHPSAYLRGPPCLT